MPAIHPAGRARTRADAQATTGRHRGKQTCYRAAPVITVSDHVPGERARFVAQGQRHDDHSSATLVIIHEENGSWTIHGLGAPGVTLSKTDMIALAESILARVR